MNMDTALVLLAIAVVLSVVVCRWGADSREPGDWRNDSR